MSKGSVERLYVLCEGHTEEAFVNAVLRPHFQAFNGTTIVPLLPPNRPRATGRQFKGGWVSYRKAKSALMRWLEEHHGDKTWFTTMLDLYAIPNDFPKLDAVPAGTNGEDRPRFLQQAFYEDVATKKFWRFTPYLQRHEFEALLLVDPKAIEQEFLERPGCAAAIAADIGHDPPEDVDGGRESAPSKRIIRAVPEYAGRKASSGPLIAARIGLPRLRARCPHFGAWLEELERRVL